MQKLKDRESLEETVHRENYTKTLKFALLGNPNCGKTTLFNQLTGSNQYVGNWPGVTVEKKEGKLKCKENDINIVDLPGIYSLSPYSSEEIITRNYLIGENPELIINIIDSTNIERNLYLTTQLMELGKPIIIALNMVDMLEKRGDRIDYKLLQELLGVPVVPISASRSLGLKELISLAIKEVKTKDKYIEVKNIYSPDLNLVVKKIEKVLNEASDKNINNRFNAIKIFEDDIITTKAFNFNDEQKKNIDSYKKQITTTKYMDREMIVADQRYKYICKICSHAVIKSAKHGEKTISDKIDKIVTNRFLAIPLFFVLMLSIFFVTFGPMGNFLKDKAQWLISGVFSSAVSNGLDYLGVSAWVKSLAVSGIIEGVGAVVSFLPQIIILFTLLSILEDSGYMARAAFIMDRSLRRIGLSGKSFVPMLMGFGCTVPAVLGTRTLENEKDKRLTILMIPFMSCSAKMPVYALFISAFFAKCQTITIFSIYLLGIVVAILTSLLFKDTILKGKPAPFVMELPPYRFPTLKSLLLHIWERTKDFLTKAGTVLLGATIVIWFLQSFNLNLQMVSESSESILAKIGTTIAPVFTLCGFGNWKASVSLVTGIASKESVVSTMAVLYNSNNGAGLSSCILSQFSTLSAYAFMAFVLLYTPCIAALSAIKKEMRSIKWTMFAIVYQIAVAWLVSALIFQFGTLIINLF